MLAKKGIKGMFWKTMGLLTFFAFPKMAYSQFGICNSNFQDVTCCPRGNSGKCFLEKYFSYSKLLFLFELDCPANHVCGANQFCVCAEGFVASFGQICSIRNSKTL